MNSTVNAVEFLWAKAYLISRPMWAAGRAESVSFLFLEVALMRGLCVVWVVAFLLFTVSGCGVSTSERVAWYQWRLGEARAVVESIDAGIEPALEQLSLMQDRLRLIESQTPNSKLAIELRQAIEKATLAIETAQARRAEVFQVIETAEASIEKLQRQGVGWGDELVAAGRIGETIAPMTGSAAPWVALGSHLIAALGGLLIRRPGDVSLKHAKQQEDKTWDEADAKAFDRGIRAGRAEGRWDVLTTPRNNQPTAP